MRDVVVTAMGTSGACGHAGLQDGWAARVGPATAAGRAVVRRGERGAGTARELSRVRGLAGKGRAAVSRGRDYWEARYVSCACTSPSLVIARAGPGHGPGNTGRRPL
ncbi:hypothetical protein GCM10007368_16880 [Isoptericola cucumis]|uniref:Uncharacterized protein n=1 Tax=Isoptericola cucumis TaxID=1776856 RepID=A0ABQ2B6N3_9MICO|nr:hypothetical protein GCM10007368_16880 [Isoptericola cucumis]